MSDPVLRLRGVTKRYGDTVAVRDLDLAVPAGATYALLGPNGSGKTTSIRMMLRIQEPDAGEVRLFGRPVSDESLDRIGYLPEERGLYKRMRAVEVLVFLAELKGVPRHESEPRIREWLERVGLADRADERVEGLSKGMQQKLQFVGTIVHDPEIVILDEPFSGLDPINQQALRDIVAALRRKGRTILFSTHIIEHAERLCDHVCILSNGVAVADGPVAEVKREHGARYVDVRLERWSAAAEDVLQAVPGVRRWTRDGTRFEAAVEDGADPQAILEALVGRGIRLDRFEVVEPTLHQVFLERVGAIPAEAEPADV